MSERLWRTQVLESTNADQMRRLFVDVFGSEMPQALWEWKYGYGRGRALVAYDAQGRMVGHYGGIRRVVSMFGHNETAVQISDVMVAQDVRGVLTRSGPFAMLTSAFLDSYIGAGKEYLVGFGFPSHRHLRIAQRLNMYAQVDTVVELHWPIAVQTSQLPWWQRIEVLDFADSRAMTILDGLWQAQRDSSGSWIVPQRDAAWWRFRLHDHPTHSYRCLLLRNRWTGRALGAVALRPGSIAGEAWELMDWIGPVSYVPCLLQAARYAAYEGGATHLQGWFSSSVATLLHTPDCSRHDIGVQVPTSIRGPGPAPDVLQGRWWLTSADTDFR